jgi:hypothetical protein
MRCSSALLMTGARARRPAGRTVLRLKPAAAPRMHSMVAV